MTIKEIESLTGMERANVRFYEREGFLTAKRMDNGYRDYSHEDLQILLRVKLLRSLNIPLEEIKALKAGNMALADTLGAQIGRLEQEQRGAAYAQEVYRAIQADRVAFADLDARKYLDGISQVSRESDSSYFTVQGDQLPQVFHPWRRFMARLLDQFLYNVLWVGILAFLFHVNLVARSSFGKHTGQLYGHGADVGTGTYLAALLPDYTGEGNPRPAIRNTGWQASFLSGRFSTHLGCHRQGDGLLYTLLQSGTPL